LAKTSHLHCVRCDASGFARWTDDNDSELEHVSEHFVGVGPSADGRWFFSCRACKINVIES